MQTYDKYVYPIVIWLEYISVGEIITGLIHTQSSKWPQCPSQLYIVINLDLQI